MEPNTEIVELEPATAMEKYLTHRGSESLSETTLNSHRYRLNHFVRWCDINNIDSLSELSGREVQDFRNWRKRDGDLNNVSWHTQMTTFRVFLKWAENYEAVPTGLHEKVDVPKMDPDEDARDETFDKGRAHAILDYLEKYHYASKKHTLFALLWHTGIRIGSARALDLGDFHRGEGYIEVKHRPDSDTALKNRDGGERPIALNQSIVNLLTDYIEEVRPDVSDGYGRRPLFATEQGRAHQTTLRSWVYQLSRPCTYRNGFCPHDRDPETCDAKRRVDWSSKCPSGFSPHTIRRSSITKWLGDDVPKEAVSDRMNAEKDALDKHYDKRTEKGKMNQRKDFFI